MDTARPHIQRRIDGTIDYDFYRRQAEEQRQVTIRSMGVSILAGLGTLRDRLTDRTLRPETVAIAIALALSLPRK